MSDTNFEKDTENINEKEPDSDVESVKYDNEDGSGAGKEKSRLVKSMLEWMELIVVSLVSAMLILGFVGRHSPVIGSSMEKTLYEKDVLIISDLAYTPKQGDIIVFASQVTGYDRPYVKRVIATEGQTVDIDFQNWIVYVDGEVVDEPYVNRVPAVMDSTMAVKYPYTVSEGCVFVMGDNRNYSTDSRAIGEVDVRHIIGKVVFRVYPFNRIGIVD